jgi:hypothetical protein
MINSSRDICIYPAYVIWLYHGGLTMQCSSKIPVHRPAKCQFARERESQMGEGEVKENIPSPVESALDSVLAQFPGLTVYFLAFEPV